MFIGGTAATVSPAGGYVQGAGHSAFSPLYGLAADNVLRTCLRVRLLSHWLKSNASEYSVVLANGSFVIANSASYPDCTISVALYFVVPLIFPFPSSILGFAWGRCWQLGCDSRCHLPHLPHFQRNSTHCQCLDGDIGPDSQFDDFARQARQRLE